MPSPFGLDSYTYRQYAEAHLAGPRPSFLSLWYLDLEILLRTQNSGMLNAIWAALGLFDIPLILLEQKVVRARLRASRTFQFFGVLATSFSWG